jgi:hypothetical protein
VKSDGCTLFDTSCCNNTSLKDAALAAMIVLYQQQKLAIFMVKVGIRDIELKS